jgi:hypothetical protein
LKLSMKARGSGDLEGRLQHRQAAQRAQQSTASRLCQNQRSRNATGRSAALRRGLRAPSRCTTEPTGLKSSQDSPQRRMRLGAQLTESAAAGDRGDAQTGLDAALHRGLRARPVAPPSQ